MVYALIVEEVNGLVDKNEVRQKVDEALNAAVIDQRTWGETPEAVAAQDAFMDLA